MPATIAIDARPLVHQHSGISIYLRELLSRLLTNREYRWVLYSDQPFPTESYAGHVLVRCGNRASRLGSSLFMQTHFPAWAKKDQVDLYWSPRHQVPLRLPTSIRRVVTLHDLVYEKHPETMTLQGRVLENLLTPRSLQHANRILTISESVQQELIARSPELAERSRAIPLASGIDEYDHSQHLTSDERYFIYCGSMEPRKNLDRLIQAFLALKTGSNPPPQRFVLVTGGGWKNTKTLALIATHPEHFIVHEKITEAEKAALIAHSDFLVLPSIYEGFGIPIVEALKLGRAVLTSNVGAMKEVVGPAGLLVDPHDEKSLRQALLRLCTDENLRTKLSSKARKQAERFSWNRTADLTQQALDEALAETPH